MTTLSAPGGTGAPVLILTTSPGVRADIPGSHPAVAPPLTLLTPGPSAAITAYPSYRHRSHPALLSLWPHLSAGGKGRQRVPGHYILCQHPALGPPVVDSLRPQTRHAPAAPGQQPPRLPGHLLLRRRHGDQGPGGLPRPPSQRAVTSIRVTAAFLLVWTLVDVGLWLLR